MGKQSKTIVLGPPGTCDNCGRYCGTLDQVGIVCWHCHAGVFLPRWCWDFIPCPDCDGGNVLCTTCWGRGCTAQPREFDLDLDALREFWQESINRMRRYKSDVRQLRLYLGTFKLLHATKY